MDNNNFIVRFDDERQASPQNEEETRPILSIKNLVALLFAAFTMMLNFLVIAIIHERIPRFYNQTSQQYQFEPPLPDISADILPEWPQALSIAEYIISVQACIIFILLFIHKYRVTIFRRFCIIIGVLYLYRAMCLMSTQVPVIKSSGCHPYMTEEQKANWGFYLKTIFQRMFHMMLGFGLTINGKHLYCGDYLYSGHTLILTGFYLFIHEYLVPKKSRSRSLPWTIFDRIVLISSMAGVLLILIARGHYLIDVILAYYVTTRTFYIYHSLISHKSLRYKTPKNYLSRFWWWYLMKYLEYDHIKCADSTRNDGDCTRCEATNTEVPRQFDWPISWKSNGKRSTSLQRLLSQTPQP